MDDKDKLITVSHNSGDCSPETENKPDDNMPLNESEDISFPEPDNSQPVNRVEYDSFMYEPIGFEELERQNQEKHREAAEKAEKRHRTRNERLIILLLAMIFIFTILLSVVCIVFDIGKSSKSVGITSGNGQNVVIYRQSKPEGANDSENFKDENGKYTTEGVASVVRPSIVEIYTYSDSRHSTLAGTGSGIVISEEGYIVTNAHVLQSDGYHVIKTYKDETFDAKIIGRDSKTDIAIIKVSGAELQPAVLGDSDEVTVGEQVMAIGNPAGLSGSVTDGIVSAMGQIMDKASEMMSDDYHYNELSVQENQNLTTRSDKIYLFIEQKYLNAYRNAKASMPNPDQLVSNVEVIPMVNQLPTPITTAEWTNGVSTYGWTDADKPVAVDQPKPFAYMVGSGKIEYRPLIGSYKVNMAKNGAGDFDNIHLIYKGSVAVRPWENAIRINLTA